MADPVDEQVNFIVNDIDSEIAAKHPFSLRDILERPQDFSDRATIQTDIDSMKDDISAYFGRKKEQVADEAKAYAKDASKASKAAESIADAIKSAAKSAKKSVITPLAYARDEERDEILFVDAFDEASLPGAVSALVNDALFVVNTSLEIDGYTVGRWLFPSSNTNRNRALYVSFPVNPAGALDIARDQMLMALDAVKDEIGTKK